MGLPKLSRLAPPLLATFLAACSQSPTPPPSYLALPISDPNYVIGPNDRVNVLVYRAPELSITAPVRPDGRISVPLVPDIQAAGLTPTQLADTLKGKLKEFIVEPNVSVIVESFNGPFDQQIRIIGAATAPITIPYQNNMTLLDVMIQTKGLTRYAAGNKARIMRREGGKTRFVGVRLNDLLDDGDLKQNVTMRAGDTLVIPQAWF